uniref:DDE_3 domain-containing protein n=1 Tax=Musca domestica TaxID=7370 RepID=A0A1I8M925_MUSDO
MNSSTYTELLEDALLSFMDEKTDEDSIFQQDNAAIHVSKQYKSWFNERCIPLLDWPGCSPDLTPIENLWEYMARKVYGNNAQNVSIMTVTELKLRLKQQKSIKDNNRIPGHCDENKILQQFARLYITSPERIVHLLTERPLFNTCNQVSDVLTKINKILTRHQAFSVDNLYVKLYNGLKHFDDNICQRSFSAEDKDLTNYQDCIQELHEDLIECEGPPDWFEKTNEAVVCQYLNDIVNCHYIKTAMLCGLKPALLLRTFSIGIMQEVVTVK